MLMALLSRWRGRGVRSGGSDQRETDWASSHASTSSLRYRLYRPTLYRLGPLPWWFRKYRVWGATPRYAAVCSWLHIASPFISFTLCCLSDSGSVFMLSWGGNCEPWTCLLSTEWVMLSL